jgi:hypothetical protein
MVLSDLGARLHGALAQLSKASVVDEKVSRLVGTVAVWHS